MPGRGRPRTAKSPESKPANGSASPKSQETSFSSLPLAEEKQIYTNKKQDEEEKKKQACGEVQRCNGTDVTTKKTKDTTSKPSFKQYSKDVPPEMTKTDVTTPAAAQGKPKANVTTRGKRPKTPAKPPEEVDEERRKEQVKKAESQMAEIDKEKQLSLEDNKKADVSKKTQLSSNLFATLEKLKIRMSEKSKASEVINRIEEVILGHLKSKETCFRQVERPLHTGSYYENLKISNPDEFDIMFPIPVERVDIEPFSEDGAFYTVSLKRGFKTPLKKFQSESKPLPASEILQEFRNEVKKSIISIEGVTVSRKKPGCPAVTLDVQVDSHLISLDIVLCLVVQSSWPNFTKEGLKIEGWLGRKVKQKYKHVPYYLVPKYEGKGTAESNGVFAKDTWRISFSHVEKDIFRNHGSEKTCCEKDGARCCRKDCLKLLKHLLSLLKEQDKSFDKFCSYHAKTTLLHACCSRTKDAEWADTDLDQCFERLVKDFEEHLERRELNNFFIPTQNLLSQCSQKACTHLAKCIKEQRENGFPIFNR